MNLPSHVSLELLDRYFTGGCTPDEARQVRVAIASDPMLAALQSVIDGDPVDVEAAWARFAASRWMLVRSGSALVPVEAAGATFQKVARPQSTRRALPRWMPTRLGSVASFAAGALTLLLLGLVLRPYWSKLGGTDTSTAYTTNPGQRARIALADGTIITLNVASRLEIPEHFGATTRTVRLHGEAFFQVAHVGKTPFVVEADGVRSTVLGTEFGVRAYQPNDVEVAVRSGRVAVQSAVLGASDIAHVTPDRSLLVERHQDVDAAMGFVRGRLVLADVPLRKAIADVDRWYDVDVRLADPSLGALPIHATLPSGSIGDLVEIFRNTFGVRVVRVGRTVTLYAH